MNNLERYLEKLDEETKKEVSKHFFTMLNQYRPVKGGLDKLMRQFEEWLINFTKQRAKEKKYMPGVDYNKEGKPYPENVNGNIMEKVRFPIDSLRTSARGKEFIRIEEEGPGNRYRWTTVYDTADPDKVDLDYSNKSRDWTIGIGHSIKTNEWSRFLKADGRTSVSLSSQEMDALFEEDIKVMEAGVRKALEGAFLTQYEFDALISFSFQNGQNRIAGIKYNVEDLRKYIYAGNVVEAAKFIRVFRDEYLDRRGREADMYEKGIYRNKG